jgi:hypothetical protein
MTIPLKNGFRKGARVFINAKEFASGQNGWSTPMGARSIP